MSPVLLAWLVAYAAVLSTVLGVLALLMICQLTGATWFVPFRPYALKVIGALPVLALLFLPILAGSAALYPWLSPDRLDPAGRTFVLEKGAALTLPWFTIRSLLYLGSWIVLGELLRRAYTKPDPGSLNRISAIGLIVLGTTLTYAGFDWLMSRSMPWHSSIYGLYFFVGGFVAGIALLGVLPALPRELGGRVPPLPAEPVHALGKLLLTGVLLWAYFGFSQLLIMWIANVPDEVTWYVPRLRGEWSALSAFLLAGHLVLPFALLLSRSLKRRPGFLLVLGIWMLVMHYLDTRWLIAPAGPGPSWSWLEVLWIILIAGAAFLVARWRSPGPAVPHSRGQVVIG